MSDEQHVKERVEAYLATINRLEPDITPIDAAAYYASAAISLKRIADATEAVAKLLDSIDNELAKIRQQQ